MRVLLSGTSNSVLAKGINYTFPNDPAVTAFTNRSYGASGTVALGDHLRKIDFSEHDFCVLDYCVNEEVFIWQKDSTPDAAMSNLAAAIDAASLAGCQPIVMIFPSSTRANHKRPFEEAITERLMSRGIPVFNFYTFAQRITAQGDLDFNDLFLDPMHIRREVGRFMGQAALAYMKSAMSAGRPEPRQSDLVYHPLSFVPFDDVTVSGAPQIEQRETKLAAADLLRITPGNTLKIAAGTTGAVDLAGVTCNAARTIGTLHEVAQTDTAQTNDVLTRVKASAFFALKRGLTLVTLPVTHPLHIEAGEEAVIRYDFDGTTTDLQPDPALELSGFILRHVDAFVPVHIATHATAPVALEDTISDADLIALVDMLKATPAA